MATIDFSVTNSNGAGIGVFIKVGSNPPLHFTGSGSQQMDLPPGVYTATVSGAEPSSSSVNVQVLEAGNLLCQSTFTDTAFWGFLPFTVS